MEGLLSLSSDFSSLLQDPSSSDLSILCYDGQISVHSVMLSARSPVFNSMLKSDMLEKQSGTIKIEDFKLDVVRAMVQYIYTAKIEDYYEDIRQLMMIGNKYQITALVEDCSKKLALSISRSNVLELGAFAEVYSFQALLEQCAKFIYENLDVLEHNWKEKIRTSPLFLTNILGFIVSGLDVQVCRFESEENPGDGDWQYYNNNKDAITVTLSRSATLTSIGLFGSKQTHTIPVKVEVTNLSTSETIYSTETSYKSTGTPEPVKIPMTLEMEAETEYTIGVVIFSDVATYFGVYGYDSVNIRDGKLEVSFMDTNESTNQTTRREGQIPSLGFKVKN